MRFPSIAIAAGLVSAAALVVSCGDLFHGTNWETLCESDASAPGCNAGGGNTTGHTSSSRASSGSGGSGGTSASGGGGAGPDPCLNYCNEVVTGCMTALPQYETVANCTNVCEILPHQKMPMADNIPCRDGYAAKVANDSTNCAAAGPGGGGECGPICDAYCLLMTTRCPGVVGPSSECAATCMTYNPLPVYSTAAKTGNTLACRLYWAVQSVDDTTHCSEAGPDSTACVDADM